tara:strand:+ start:75 stop:263 length:189 start_codon:yes stop_codon:yes gene_type:complete
MEKDNENSEDNPELDITIKSKEFALWTKVKEKSSEALQRLKDEVVINAAVKALAVDKLKELD